MAKRKQGIIYGRKSRENAATLESQINACIQWCENNKVDYEIMAEEGSASSEDWNRPKLQEMIKKIENLEFDYVIVTEQTRISRTEDFSMFKKLLRETNTILILADTNESINYNNPNDSVKSGIQQVFGEYELSTAKIRLKRGTVQSAKKGNWVGKKVPVGYVYDKKTKRLKKSDEAHVIRRMFELYLEGMSTKDIAYLFEHENVVATYIEKGEFKQMIWTPAGVSRMINNIVYAGHTLYGKTTEKKVKGKRKTLKTDQEKQILIEDTHEGIVSNEEWDRVQEILKKRNSRPPSLKLAKHVFSGLIVCAECGSVHSFQTSKGGKKRISSCQNRTYNEEWTDYTVCKNGGSNLEPFESLFYAWLAEEAAELENYIELIEQAEISDEQLKIKKEAKKTAMQKQIQQIKKKASKIQNLIEDDFYEDEDEEAEKRKEVKNLKNQIKQLENEIKKAEQEENENESIHLKRILNNMKKFLTGKENPDMSEREANEILSEIILKIEYKKVGKEIKIKAYLKPEVKEIFDEIEIAKAS